MKHVELNLCFVREKAQSGHVIVNFLPASDQIADILTKPLTEKVFVHFKKNLGVVSLTDAHHGYDLDAEGFSFLSPSSIHYEFDSD